MSDPLGPVIGLIVGAVAAIAASLWVGVTYAPPVGVGALLGITFALVGMVGGVVLGVAADALLRVSVRMIERWTK